MNENTHNILEEDLSELFGFTELTAEEKTTLLDDLGSTILESAALRFMVESDESVTRAFESFIEQESQNEEMLTLLMQNFPRFAEILEEEIAAFKADAKATLSA